MRKEYKGPRSQTITFTDHVMRAIHEIAIDKGITTNTFIKMSTIEAAKKEQRKRSMPLK